MVLAPNSTGCAFVEPAALTARWELRLGPPLLTPSTSYQAFLPSILTGSLKNGLGWTTSWLGPLMSASAWMQVA